MSVMNEMMAKMANSALKMATEEQWNMIRESTIHAEEALALFNDVTEDKNISEEELEKVLSQIFASAGGITGNALQAYFASMMKKVFG